MSSHAPRGICLLTVLILVAFLSAVVPAAASVVLPDADGGEVTLPESTGEFGKDYGVLPLPLSIFLCGLAAVALVVCAFCFFPRTARRSKKRDK